MKAWNRCFQNCVAAALLMVLNGCSNSGSPKLPDTVKVTGTVTLDDKPLEGAAIRFVPTTTQGVQAATGVSDASGKYELFTDFGTDKSRPGAIPGAYVVYVNRLVKSDGSLVAPNSSVPPMMSGAKESIPMKYSTSQAQLRYEVKPEGGTFNLKLDTKPDQPIGGPGGPSGPGGLPGGLGRPGGAPGGPPGGPGGPKLAP